jgi:23S rRNA (uracil1939-C5)-methyltransferase
VADSDGPVVDLYAGVGLFAVTLAALGRRDVTAIENDPVSARDLLENAQPFGDAIRVERTPVEAFLAQRDTRRPATLIVDPPRTGMSRAAMTGILASDARRIVYVSCDVATLARDTRRLLDAGYTLASIEAVDMFPNTAHVEGVAVFDRKGTADTGIA